MEKAKDVLKIEPGETTEDGLFSLEETRCIGACEVAPVFTVNEKVYGKADAEMFEDVIKKLKGEWEYGRTIKDCIKKCW